MRGFWTPLAERGSGMRLVCWMFGHKFRPVVKRKRINPYYVPLKECARCGQRG